MKQRDYSMGKVHAANHGVRNKSDQFLKDLIFCFSSYVYMWGYVSFADPLDLEPQVDVSGLFGCQELHPGLLQELSHHHIFNLWESVTAKMNIKPGFLRTEGM